MLAELIKVAYSLDRKGEYDLANEVDEVIKELAQRAGLSQEDMVALADHFDGEGETKLADRFDALLKQSKKIRD